MPVGESRYGESERESLGQATVSVERRAEGVIVYVAGEIDMVSTPMLDRTVERVLGERPGVVVFDLSGVTFFSSTGLAILTVAHRRAEGRTTLRIAAPAHAARRALELTGMVDDLAVYPDVSTALVP